MVSRTPGDEKKGLEDDLRHSSQNFMGKNEVVFFPFWINRDLEEKNTHTLEDTYTRARVQSSSSEKIPPPGPHPRVDVTETSSLSVYFP